MRLEGAESQVPVERAVAVLVHERWQSVHPPLLAEAVGTAGARGAESPPGAARTPPLVGSTDDAAVR